MLVGVMLVLSVMVLLPDCNDIVSGSKKKKKKKICVYLTNVTFQKIHTYIHVNKTIIPSISL